MFEDDVGPEVRLPLTRVHLSASRPWRLAREALTCVKTVKALTKGHLSENVERIHLIPLGHVQTFASSSCLLSKNPDKLINDSPDYGLLCQQPALRECRVQHLTHSTVLLGISLASHTLAAETGREDLVERALARNRFLASWVAINGLPGFDTSE